MAATTIASMGQGRNCDSVSLVECMFYSNGLKEVHFRTGAQEFREKKTAREKVQTRSAQERLEGLYEL